jgi:hypothetical protein
LDDWEEVETVFFWPAGLKSSTGDDHLSWRYRPYRLQSRPKRAMQRRTPQAGAGDNRAAGIEKVPISDGNWVCAIRELGALAADRD